MIVSLIAAMDEDRVIGIDNRLPWRLPADLQWFKAQTLGKPVLMGRKTFESLGRPLPGRTNIVVSRDPDFAPAGVRVARDADAALALAGDATEVMVIGGASFYTQMLPRAQRLYLTRIHTRVRGDAWFPEFDPAQWQEILREDHPADAANPYPYTFLILQRRHH